MSAVVLQPSPSRAAFLVRKYFKEQNVDIPLAMAQEAVARSLGYEDWNVLTATVDVRAAPRQKVVSLSTPLSMAGRRAPFGKNYEPDSREDFSLQRFSILILMCGGVRLSPAGAKTPLRSIHEVVLDFARGVTYVHGEAGSPGEDAFSFVPLGDNAPTRLSVTIHDFMSGVPLAANGMRLPNGIELWVVPEEDENVTDEAWQCPAVVLGAGQKVAGVADYDGNTDSFSLQDSLQVAAGYMERALVMVEIRGQLCEIKATEQPGIWRL
jgi:hypothetical protein